MRIEILEAPRVIWQNNASQHRYFGWPSVARLQDGSLAAVGSGFRLEHICPFGKGVLLRSYDEGTTWSAPEVIIDTPLDDRDCGICTFGEKDVIVTSFTNTPDFQRSCHPDDPYILGYLERVEKAGNWKQYLGSTYVLSHDGGKTFGPVALAPVSSPHGPCVLTDGTLLYVGRFFDGEYDSEKGAHIGAYAFDPASETFVRRGTIADVNDVILSCEPHAICLPDGKLVVHIRMERDGYFSTWQSESYDGGYTFTAPHPLLDKTGGAPAHLLRLPSGRLISVYGYRNAPYGLRVMVSDDNAESWTTGLVLTDIFPSGDLGYPCSVLTNDGAILTVFYAVGELGGPALLWQIKWKLAD